MERTKPPTGWRLVPALIAGLGLLVAPFILVLGLMLAFTPGFEDDYPWETEPFTETNLERWIEEYPQYRSWLEEELRSLRIADHG